MAVVASHAARTITLNLCSPEVVPEVMCSRTRQQPAVPLEPCGELLGGHAQHVKLSQQGRELWSTTGTGRRKAG